MVDYLLYYLTIGLTIYIVVALIDSFAKGAVLDPSKEFIVFTVTVTLWVVLLPMMIIDHYKYYRDKNKLKRKP